MAKREPSVAFTQIPPSNLGGPFKLVPVSGRAEGARPGQRIVIYALTDTWWIQPFAKTPFTEVQPDFTWRASIHSGTAYAALLVDPGYAPKKNIRQLPAKGGPVRALAITKGTGHPAEAVQPKTLHFSGYDWEAKPTFSPRGGGTNYYNPQNAWIDDKGFLHLRITQADNHWDGCEVRLTASLGHGTYLFTVSDVSRMDSAAVLTLFTWDAAADEHHRELDVEVSRWGDPTAKNTQFLIQPYYEPANVFRFETPAGRVTYSFRWQPSEVSFRAARGSEPGRTSKPLSEHAFTSGVPSPGGESAYIDIYAFGKTRMPMRAGSEVVIEKFEFLP